MHLQTTVLLLLSAISAISAQQNPACSQLAGYAPAVNYCGSRYPAPIPTVTRTETKTVTVRPTSTTSVKPSTTSTLVKPNTTSAIGNGKTRTITAIAETTVTNCASFTLPPCPASTAKIAAPGPANPFSNAAFARPVSPVSRPNWGRVSPREAEPEADPQFGASRGGFGGFSNSFASAFQAAAWGRLMGSGDSNIQNACSCLRPAASKTVTISATATVTTTVK